MMNPWFAGRDELFPTVEYFTITVLDSDMNSVELLPQRRSFGTPLVLLPSYIDKDTNEQLTLSRSFMYEKERYSLMPTVASMR